MTYLDNAATSYPKPKCVIKEVLRCLNDYCGNPGRSSHSLAVSAATSIYETRELIARFLKAERFENVVFTPNATYALNLAIKGLAKPNCHLILSDMEHNSVLRPAYKCAGTRGCSISFFDSDLPPNKAILPLVRNGENILITSIASNVTGRLLDINSISDVVNKCGLKWIIDASQFLGHRQISLASIPYSALCSAGHKALFGIQGSGFVVFNSLEQLDTLAEGGSGVDSFATDMPLLLPERFEPGTLSTPAIVSLRAGIEYIEETGIHNIETKLNLLTEKAVDILYNFKNINVYGAENGIISFNISNYSSSYVSGMLNDLDIATRSGFHCAPLIHKKLGTADRGTVRISLSYMNTSKDLDKLYKALRYISK